ncbi:helix-turn-helix transcriptional regulator [Litorivivens sp.]|uniref:helix-turn-helix transcriptional regulator n=1 Tax=Litorivivens sp. TaxID=2020868 RepID=UPI00356201A1
MSRASKPPGNKKSELIWQAVKSLARSSEGEEPDRLGQYDTLSTFGLRRELATDGNRGYMEFALTSPYLTVMRSAFTTSEEHLSIATTERDVLRIRLGLSGSVSCRNPSGDNSVIEVPSCLMVAQPKATEMELTVLPMEHYRFVGFVISRGTLLDAWGFDPSALPEPLRSFELGETNSLEVIEVAMSSEMVNIATDIMKCRFSGALLDQFLEAKAREALCYLMAELNRPDENQVADAEVRLTSRDRSALAEARLIIDKSYASPPSINVLARKVGLNRNKLCAGFRTAYGLSIHEYARELRLQNALELLRQGAISITEVAEQVGYGHSSSLTAAIKRRFGVSPRQLKR